MEKVYACSLLLSILHSLLFWDKQPGISVILFTATALILLIYLLKKGKLILKEKEIFWSIPILLLSGTYFIFNNIIFEILNIIAIIILFLIMIIGITNKEETVKGYVIRFIETILRPIELLDIVLEDLKNRIISKTEGSENSSPIKKLLKAMLIALPIVIVVLLLLSSADSIFRGLFSSFESILKNIKIHDLFFRVILIIVLFIYFVCFSVNLIKKDSPYNKKEMEKSDGIKIDNFTINTIMILLNIIYLVFSVIQFQNLFMHLGNTQEFNFAQYARQGFFQLMFVSFINFAIIFVATINKKEETKQKIKLQKILEILLILFTIIIIASSFVRMYLYEQAYGYTHLRLFVYVVLITELISMLPVIAYILGLKFNLFKTIVIIVTTMYVGLNYINVDELIAKNNINKYFAEEETKKDEPLYKAIDFNYLETSTKTDAFPQMMRLLDSKNQEIVDRTKRYLDNQILKYRNKNNNWQEFNISIQKIKNTENIN